jgi:hypothetical protein
VVGIGGQESEVSTGQYPADHVASYASQHKKGLPVDRSSRQAGPPLVFQFLTPLLRGRGIPLISSYINIKLIEVYSQAEYLVLGIDFFKSSNPLVKGLLLIIKLNIAASDKPNKGIL